MTRKVLVDLGNYKYQWIEQESFSRFTGPTRKPSVSGDPTIDQEINNKGGIFSHADNKVYTNKRDYLASIKEAGCHIKDY